MFSAICCPPSFETRFLYMPSTVDILRAVKVVLMETAWVRGSMPFGVTSLLEMSRDTRLLANLMHFDSSTIPASLSLFFFRSILAIRSIPSFEYFYSIFIMHFAKFRES